MIKYCILNVRTGYAMTTVETPYPHINWDKDTYYPAIKWFDSVCEADFELCNRVENNINQNWRVIPEYQLDAYRVLLS